MARRFSLRPDKMQEWPHLYPAYAESRIRKTMMRNAQGGWTLPFIPIVIIIIGVLAYFFGWMVFAYAAGLFVLITLCVFIYDLFTAGPEGDEATSYWFTSDRKLTELWKVIPPH